MAVQVGVTRYVFSNKGAVLKSLTIEGYEEGDTGELVELVTQRDGSPWPFALVNRDGEEVLGEVLWEIEKETPERWNHGFFPL